MAQISLTRLYLQEEDHELTEVRCKHGFILHLLTSWTPRNSSRRYWGCPYYGDDYIDSRSKFVIPKLLGIIAELETSDKEINKPTKLTKSMESKIDMNKIE
ncbi:hypothetical protein RDI58_015333 [Solanum bulbocastanum]|uniref:Uncharacterized protein n=1 Tax=Solanum bulbocastanum TaxID=147425 RepID=A0AAN8YEW4_SOLBU